jgi:hypothetical protein
MPAAIEPIVLIIPNAMIHPDACSVPGCVEPEIVEPKPPLPIVARDQIRRTSSKIRIVAEEP